MKNVYVCTTCGEIVTPEYFADGKPVCPNGDNHSVFPLVQACDIINAFFNEGDSDNDLNDWGWGEDD